MKRGCFIFVFLFLFVGFVSSMEDPIVVEANPGDSVRIYVWPLEYGPALNFASGDVDEDGVFMTTFFSLSTSDVKYQVYVYDSEGDKTHGETFTGYGIDEPLKIDCTFLDKCVMSSMTDVELAAYVESDSSVEVLNESKEEVFEVVGDVNESSNVSEVVINNSVVVNEVSSGFEFSYLKNRGELFFYLVGGILTFIVFMVMYFKFETFRDYLTRLNYVSEDGELARLEAEIKRKDDLIKKVKAEKYKKKKIKLAKAKLERENKILERMVRGRIKDKSKK